MTYQMQEGYFSLGQGDWKDRSINMLAAMHLPARGANLTVTREPLPPGVEFGDYISSQKRTMEKELGGFELVADSPDSIDGMPAHFLEFSWKHQGNLTHQMVLVINIDDRVLNLTATIPGGLDISSRDELLSIMRGFRLGAAPPPEGGTPQ